jgi:hypothetical protein
VDGTRLVGAHVDLDGTVIADTGLVTTYIDTDTEVPELAARFKLRGIALKAVAMAYAECGMAFDAPQERTAKRQINLSLPIFVD